MLVTPRRASAKPIETIRCQLEESKLCLDTVLRLTGKERRSCSGSDSIRVSIEHEIVSEDVTINTSEKESRGDRRGKNETACEERDKHRRTLMAKGTEVLCE